MIGLAQIGNLSFFSSAPFGISTQPTNLSEPASRRIYMVHPLRPSFPTLTKINYILRRFASVGLIFEHGFLNMGKQGLVLTKRLG